MCVQCLGMLPSRRVPRPGRALTFESRCGATAIAMFLLAVEPGAVLLCQGWDDDFAQPLGLPTAPAAMDAETGTWTRSFARGATATVFADGHGSVSWGGE